MEAGIRKRSQGAVAITGTTGKSYASSTALSNAWVHASGVESIIQFSPERARYAREGRPLATRHADSLYFFNTMTFSTRSLAS